MTDEETLEVDLVHTRWRDLAWAAVGLFLGGFLMWRLAGLASKLIGVAVFLGGLHAARLFVRTLRHPAGKITVRRDDLVLVPALCAGESLTLPLAEVKHVYFIRRSQPWSAGGPVLIIETSRGVFSYRREWFAGETDQRRLASALNLRLGRIEP